MGRCIENNEIISAILMHHSKYVKSYNANNFQNYSANLIFFCQFQICHRISIVGWIYVRRRVARVVAV